MQCSKCGCDNPFDSEHIANCDGEIVNIPIPIICLDNKWIIDVPAHEEQYYRYVLCGSSYNEIKDY